jgi:hypothetical protein
MKRAAVFVRTNGWYCSPYNQTTAGVWMSAEPYVKLARDANAAALGRAVLNALGESKGPVPHPAESEWNALLKPLLEAAGVKSWKAFVLRAQYMSVDEEGETVTICPNVNREPREGFIPLSDRDIRLPVSASAEELGEAIQTAALLCE